MVVIYSRLFSLSPTDFPYPSTTYFSFFRVQSGDLPSFLFSSFLLSEKFCDVAEKGETQAQVCFSLDLCMCGPENCDSLSLPPPLRDVSASLGFPWRTAELKGGGGGDGGPTVAAKIEEEAPGRFERVRPKREEREREREMYAHARGGSFW